jgi:tetratricopeptide (TPR) repeat protein
LKARIEGSYGRWTEAEALADALIAENPAYVDALLVKAQFLEYRNERKQAIATAERALEVKPSSVPVLATLGSGSDHGVIFGDFTSVMIGTWGALEIVVDPYALKKSGGIEVTLNSFHDFLVRQPLSFNVSTDSAAQ